jgi:hypothetical protein
VGRSPLRNVFACLVHENLECTVDLVRNLRFFEPDSAIVVYDGSGGSILQYAIVLERLGAVMHPEPRPVSWGRLHDFAFDCLEYALDRHPFDALTFVDSDQLLAHRVYCKSVAAALEQQPQAGVLASPSRAVDALGHQANLALQEKELWLPLLERFPRRRDSFPRFSYWPGTVITGAAAAAVCGLRDDAILADILERTSIEATEEVVIPTLAALCGYEVVARPWNDEWLRWGVPLGPSDVAAALADPACFWLHPVERHTDDPARVYLRRSSHEYHAFTPWPSAS